MGVAVYLYVLSKYNDGFSFKLSELLLGCLLKFVNCVVCGILFVYVCESFESKIKGVATGVSLFFGRSSSALASHFLSYA